MRACFHPPLSIQRRRASLPPLSLCSEKQLKPLQLCGTPLCLFLFSISFVVPKPAHGRLVNPIPFFFSVLNCLRRLILSFPTLFSRYPIRTQCIRFFQEFVPGHIFTWSGCFSFNFPLRSLVFTKFCGPCFPLISDVVSTPLSAGFFGFFKTLF